MHRTLWIVWSRWGLKRVARDVVRDLAFYGAKSAADRFVHKRLRDKHGPADYDRRPRPQRRAPRRTKPQTSGRRSRRRGRGKDDWFME